MNWDRGEVQEIYLKRLLSTCRCWNPLSGSLIGRTTCVVAHGMGDSGYDHSARPGNAKIADRALLARSRRIFRPMAGQRWRVPTSIATPVASASLKTVGGAGR